MVYLLSYKNIYTNSSYFSPRTGKGTSAERSVQNGLVQKGQSLTRRRSKYE